MLRFGLSVARLPLQKRETENTAKNETMYYVEARSRNNFYRGNASIYYTF
jgi:hypothetical protein